MSAAAATDFVQKVTQDPRISYERALDRLDEIRAACDVLMSAINGTSEVSIPAESFALWIGMLYRQSREAKELLNSVGVTVYGSTVAH